MPTINPKPLCECKCDGCFWIVKHCGNTKCEHGPNQQQWNYDCPACVNKRACSNHAKDCCGACKNTTFHPCLCHSHPQQEGVSLGDKVEKVKGYRFVGTVVARFTTREGNVRFVVEQDIAENGGGLLHIFNSEQLRKI